MAQNTGLLPLKAFDVELCRTEVSTHVVSPDEVPALFGQARPQGVPRG